jgi:hypothetical protein
MCGSSPVPLRPRPLKAKIHPVPPFDGLQGPELAEREGMRPFQEVAALLLK